MSLQTNHNTTTTSLQRELDKLRQEHQSTKIQLRELEMGNDDLERNERAVSSSLADVEAKYSRVLEEKILLEHELLDKANLEEESQRLKDELRGEHLILSLQLHTDTSLDANVEISILKDQLAVQSSASSNNKIPPPPPPELPQFPSTVSSSEEDLPPTPPSPDMQLSDLVQCSDDLLSTLETPRRPSNGQSALLQHAGFQPTKPTLSIPRNANASAFPSLSTLPSPSFQPTLPSPRAQARPLVRIPSNASTSSIAGASIVTASKSKGVQMVSEMRARVRNLEQKIHTRVPRLRMGSITGRANANNLAMSTMSPPSGPSLSSSKASAKLSMADERPDKLLLQRHSLDIEAEKKMPSVDTSGWVLIMEDSSPEKENEKEIRGPTSPIAPTAFRSKVSTSTASPTLGSSKSNFLAQSTINTGIRRPQSRLSAASLSTTTTSSSIPTPSSRPATPTYLPLPTSGSYSHLSATGYAGLKRSVGPGSTPYGQPKRSSLGSNAAVPPMPSLESIITHRDRPMTLPPPPRPASDTTTSSYNSKSDRNVDGHKALPTLPGLHTNVTMRPPSKLPASSSGNSLLSQSRIGRLSTGSSGRRSTGGDDSNKKEVRPRSGSTNTGFGRNGI